MRMMSDRSESVAGLTVMGWWWELEDMVERREGSSRWASCRKAGSRVSFAEDVDRGDDEG